MGRRNNRRTQETSFQPAPFETEPEFERTLADAEADEKFADVGDTACPCGSTEFLLEAFLHVVDGRPKPEPVDVESLTCPKCGREFEAVVLENGRIARGEFRGWTELDD